MKGRGKPPWPPFVRLYLCPCFLGACRNAGPGFGGGSSLPPSGLESMFLPTL